MKYLESDVIDKLCYYSSFQKFATQNRQLKLKWSEAKQQLLEAQEEIAKLQLKIRLYQPTIPESD